MALEPLPAADPERAGLCRPVKSAEAVSIALDDQLTAAQLRLDGIGERQAVVGVYHAAVEIKEVVGKFGRVYGPGADVLDRDVHVQGVPLEGVELLHVHSNTAAEMRERPDLNEILPCLDRVLKRNSRVILCKQERRGVRLLEQPHAGQREIVRNRSAVKKRRIAPLKHIHKPHAAEAYSAAAVELLGKERVPLVPHLLDHAAPVIARTVIAPAGQQDICSDASVVNDNRFFHCTYHS